MASVRTLTAPLRSAFSCLSIASSRIAQPSLMPYQTLRTFVRHTSENSAKYKRKDAAAAQAKKKKKYSTKYKQYDLRDADRYTLCDAMQYLRAFEVGRDPTSSKYELAVKLRALKNSPIIRNRIRLPHTVKSNVRICVICPPGSKAEAEAKKAGAELVGEENVFELVKEGQVEFDRCICHVDSLPALNKANLGRILGPKGLMPSAKTGTVVKEVAKTVRDMVGGSVYKERVGVVRLAIGQLGFTPEELRANIRAFMDQLKKDIATLTEQTPKDIHEVVLSSTNGPGFSLNGEFRKPTSVPVKDLSNPL